MQGADWTGRKERWKAQLKKKRQKEKGRRTANGTRRLEARQGKAQERRSKFGRKGTQKENTDEPLKELEEEKHKTLIGARKGSPAEVVHLELLELLEEGVDSELFMAAQCRAASRRQMTGDIVNHRL